VQVINLTLLFNPQSFLTAVMQTTARRNDWPLDKTVIQTEVGTQQWHLLVSAVFLVISLQASLPIRGSAIFKTAFDCSSSMSLAFRPRTWILQSDQQAALNTFLE
jgi:hypothetical protein